MTSADHYARQVAQTLQSLQAVDDATLVGLTRLGLGEVQALKQEVAEIFPASNLPAFLLQGLVQLQDRTLRPERVAADLGVLFRGTKQVGLYGAFLAAPALVIQGYQRLVTLAGKDPESAFPDGPWQFYTEFGLREDAARHSVETTAFASAAPALDDVAAATCWVATALAALFAYDDLLENEWLERITLRTLDELLAERVEAELGASLPKKPDARARAIADRVDAGKTALGVGRLAAGWAARRPYSGPPGPTLAAYAAARQAQFRAYLAETLAGVPAELRAALDARVAARQAAELPRFQAQMTILATLQAGSYQDHRIPLALHEASVALVAGGRTYLLDACARDEGGRLLLFPEEGLDTAVPLPVKRDEEGGLRDRYGRSIEVDRRGVVRAGGQRLGRLRPPPLNVVAGWVAAVLGEAREGAGPAADQLLAEAPRERQAALRALLDRPAQEAVAALGRAPIVVSWDERDALQPLTAIRRAPRGCGDHALTLFRTTRSTVFDLSHIFFDGGWGMSVAEILTAHATALRSCTPAPAPVSAPTPLPLGTTATFVAAARQAAAASPAEAAAETSAVDLELITRLRRRLGRRTMPLTVNDLLVLARCAQPAVYRPGALARHALEHVAALDPAIVELYERHLAEQRTINPALLIPMDASATDPRLRLFPATFRNPLPELLPRLDVCNQLIPRLQQGGDAGLHERFEAERRALAGDLQRFHITLAVLKRVTMQGESFNTAALRLLGHLPGVMQHIVDLIPQKIGVLNEILKGREVFSNVGQAAPGSSLTRFASARDDGATKLLIWGVMSDASGSLAVTLRDFRPHVAPLARAGRADLAQLLAQDYVDHYAALVNALARRLQRVLAYT
jgi:hypothetical protein